MGLLQIYLDAARAFELFRLQNAACLKELALFLRDAGWFEIKTFLFGSAV